MVRMRRFAMLLALAITACSGTVAPSPDPLAGTYTAVAAESATPIAERLTSAFAAKHPGMSWTVKDVGSGAALELVAAGEADAGFLSRDPTVADLARAQVIGLGYTGQVLIVHPSNPLTGLSQTELRGIFDGTITDWREVGGVPGPILVVLRADSSPTRTALDPLLRAPGAAYRSDAISSPDAQSMLNTVAASPRAIGMISALHLEPVAAAPRAIAVDGVAPTKANVASGTYRYRRAISLIFRANRSLVRPGADAFREFVHGDEGQRVLREIF